MYNDSKAAHLYPPFFDIPCSAKNYKIAPALTLMAPLLQTEENDQRASRARMVRSALTEKQYRRLHMYYLQGMTEAEIADLEGVGQQRVSKSLISGIAVLKNFIKIF